MCTVSHSRGSKFTELNFILFKFSEYTMYFVAVQYYTITDPKYHQFLLWICLIGFEKSWHIFNAFIAADHSQHSNTQSICLNGPFFFLFRMVSIRRVRTFMACLVAKLDKHQVSLTLMLTRTRASHGAQTLCGFTWKTPRSTFLVGV